MKISGRKHWLWRAVDQEGVVLVILVQSRRNQDAAELFLRRLVDGRGYAPRVVITDKLAIQVPCCACSQGRITGGTRGSITAPSTPVAPPVAEDGYCSGSNHPRTPSSFSLHFAPLLTTSAPVAPFSPHPRTTPPPIAIPLHRVGCGHGARRPVAGDQLVQTRLRSPAAGLNPVNVTIPPQVPRIRCSASGVALRARKGAHLVRLWYLECSLFCCSHSHQDRLSNCVLADVAVILDNCVGM
ncbi:MAG TPA: DDE-type integrase/transposase/recombinase [Chloroflexota bacterium]|nr:DDE-type integrase/transposase/recombinase [Chloroflexota bacterium]